MENSNIKDQMRDLRQTYEASVGQLREKQRQLEVAQVENQLLKMKVKQSADVPLSCLLVPFSPLSCHLREFHLLAPVCLVGVLRILVANPTGLGSRALRGFVCLLLSVQIGVPREHPQRALLPQPQWPLKGC